MVIGTRATDRISALIERAKGGERKVLDLDERGESDSWDVSPAERHSPHVAFIPIIEGCNSFVRFALFLTLGAANAAVRRARSSRK
jgi:tRNA A37 methylthiotransferase MiaB